uniref:CCHC-type domain-containing protein n=1 Tax=Nicotiana tabacum TaxID=4097 RepID=A0A1S3YI25_TOBAC|nr:PREDICTED: uncharacterized protein LOC107776496 [Nicotiana tabacum]
MENDEQRRLDRFERLRPPAFSSAESEDAQDFLNKFQRMLQTAAQSTPCAPSIQGSSVPGSFGTYSGSQSPPQSLPSFSERGCFECGDLGHIKRYCPHLTRGPAQ